MKLVARLPMMPATKEAPYFPTIYKVLQRHIFLCCSFSAQLIPIETHIFCEIIQDVQNFLLSLPHNSAVQPVSMSYPLKWSLMDPFCDKS